MHNAEPQAVLPYDQAAATRRWMPYRGAQRYSVRAISLISKNSNWSSSRMSL